MLDSIDPLRVSVAVNLIFMVALGVAIALAVVYRAEAIRGNRRALHWLSRYRAMRREAAAFRASVPPPTGYRDKLPYWDAYELNRFAERSGVQGDILIRRIPGICRPIRDGTVNG